jgi:hypothetical protein
MTGVDFLDKYLFVFSFYSGSEKRMLLSVGCLRQKDYPFIKYTPAIMILTSPRFLCLFKKLSIQKSANEAFSK